MSTPFTAIELFCGAGGLSIGLERAGFKIAIANEVEPDFAKTFQINHPDTRVLTCDIHLVNFENEAVKSGLSTVTLLSGGPPCQGFSTVGSKNQHDPRNSLFFEFIRAARELRPSYVLFENVSGFKKLFNGIAFNALSSELKNLGYEINAAVLDASDFGLPQERQRTIVVGWGKGLTPVLLPTPTHSGKEGLFEYQRKLTLMDAISDLPPLEAAEEKTDYKCEPMNDYQKKMRGDETKLTEHNSSNYGEKMKEILRSVPYGGSVNDLPVKLRPKSYFKNTYSRLLPDRPSPTITRNFGTPSSSRCIHPFQNRALSTREGARLQGFHDSYKFYGSKISKNLQIGNAVPPIFGEIIAKEIIKSISVNVENIKVFSSPKYVVSNFETFVQ